VLMGLALFDAAVFFACLLSAFAFLRAVASGARISSEPESEMTEGARSLFSASRIRVLAQVWLGLVVLARSNRTFFLECAPCSSGTSWTSSAGGVMWTYGEGTFSVMEFSTEMRP
jgi:hypothetical protein